MLGSDINRHKTFIACGFESLFSLSLILPCCYVTSVELPQVLLISDTKIRLLMRTSLTISSENGSLNCCQESSAHFQTSPTVADIYLL